MWKNEEITFVKTVLCTLGQHAMISRNFGEKMAGVNLRIFHTVMWNNVP